MSCTASQAIVAFSLMCNYFIWTDERLEESSPVCSFLAFLLTAFNLTTSLWVLVMSIIVHRTAIRVSKEECIEEVRLPLEIFMHALVWPFGLIIASIPLWSVSGVCYVELLCGWCWIDSEPWYARFVYTYMIEWIAIGVTIVLYAHVGMMLRGLLWVSFFKLHKHPHNNHAHRKALLALRQTIVYPLAMVLVWVPCSVARIIEAVNGHDDLHTSQAIAVILPCGGLFLFIAYVLTADLRSDCRTKCCHLKSYNAMNYNTSDLQKHY
ncbi:hypothetical protein Pelo_16532 [Pelomyxa schiedti]|nr:hypothetical protein Pelo_16532 [Pelomyxa schiedti]